MTTSVIRHRVADFLKQHPPFDALSSEELLHLAGSGKVKFHESEEYLFRQGDAKGKFVWVIQQGRVDSIEETPAGEQLRDALGEGDIPGLESLASGVYRYSARTTNDVILYGVATEGFESAIARNPPLQRFLAAHSQLSGHLGFQRSSWLESELPPIEYWRARRPQAAEAPALDAPASTRSVVRRMLETQSDQINVDDATIPADELALFSGHNPVRLNELLRQAGSGAELTPLLRQATRTTHAALAQPGDVDDCCRMSAAALSALTQSCMRLGSADVAAEGFPQPAVPHCWVMFGAAARGDLLTPRLPAIAVLYDDSAADLQPEDSLYFVAAAGQALGRLAACGLADEGWDWPAGAQPSMPLAEWKRLYSETIRNPSGHDLYARREFFDIVPLAGDHALLTELQDHILKELSVHATAVPLLASDTLKHMPPLTFFRGMVLDIEGAAHDSFDIAQALIAPVTNAARVFALTERRLTPANTLVRLEALPQLRAAADTFRIALYYQTLAGGSLLAPAKLGKIDQRLLKTAFASIQRFIEFANATLGQKP